MKKKIEQSLVRLSFFALLCGFFSLQVAQAQCPANTWISRASAADNQWSSVTYGNGLFVAVAQSGTGNRVMTSPDGINWTSRTSTANNFWNSVTYGNGLFVAVASSGTSNRVMTSPDGITWTSRTSAADNQWFSLTYGNGLFVAVSKTGTSNRVMTSPNGINWTSRSSAADNNWVSVTYGNGLFVAVANSGTGNRVMTSPDGINWTSRTSAVNNQWQSVTYGNSLFVAVSIDGTGNRVMTSPDGITWTSRTSASNNFWNSVTYGNGLFVAVAYTGTGNRVMTSPDGITWTSQTSASDNDWLSVTYGNGLFVAVSYAGTSNRVMTSSPLLITPSVTIAANTGNSITMGTSVTFTATPTNGGSTPAYQWKKNSNNVGSNSVTYTDAALENGDIIICALTSNDPCASPIMATSSGITIAVISTCTPTTSTFTTSACISYTWAAKGNKVYTASNNTDTIHLINTGGCDSVVTLNLVIKSATSSTINTNICPSQLPYSWNGNRTAAGTYTFTTTNSKGCDSVATLNLTVKTNTTSTTDVIICPSVLPYSWNGNRTAAGTYTFTTTNSQGCDSVATLNLLVKTNTTSITDVIICPSALPYSWNGNRTAAGTYTFTTTNSQGCDSVATLNLIVSSTTSSSTTIVSCGSYTWNGITYKTSGIYNEQFTGFGGCDSVATLNLTVVNTLPAIIGLDAVCIGSTTTLSNVVAGGVWSSIIGRATVNTNGVVTGTSKGTATIKYTKAGCGSVSKSIIINSIPLVPTINYAPGTVNPQRGAAGAFCTNRTFTVVGTPSGGVWSKTGILTVGASSGVVNTGNIAGSGSLTYTYTDANGCSSIRTIAGTVAVCAARGVNGITNEKQETRNEFTMYPNPAKSLINLSVKTLIGAGSIVVTDLYGKQVKVQSLSIGTNTIDVSSFAKGIYFVSTITSEGKVTKKLVVE